MTIPQPSVVDTFHRSLPSSLGNADTSQAWSSTAPLIGVSGEHMLLRATAGMTRRYNWVAGPSTRDSSVLMRFSYESTLAWPLTDFGPMLNYTTNNTAYMLTIQNNYSEIAIQVVINGTRYEINRRAFSLNKNTSYWLRFKRDVNGLYGRIWQEGTAEPTSWTITSALWNAAGAPTSGVTGVFIAGPRDAYDLKVHTYYAFTDSETIPTTYPTDTFNSRTISTEQGWGVASASSNIFLWQGAFADDPEYYGLNKKGTVSGGFGVLTTSTTDTYYGLLRTARSDDHELFTRFMFNNDPASIGTFLLGLRGTANRVSNRMRATGYAVRIDSNEQTVKIVKRTDPNAAWTVLATSPAFMSFLAGSQYLVRFQIVGTTLRARAWPDGATEPASTWHVSTTDAGIASGSPWVGLFQSAAVSRTMSIGQFDVVAPSEITGTRNFLTTGGVSFQAQPEDSKLNVFIAFADDANANATATVRHRKVEESTWTNTQGTMYLRLGLSLHVFEATGLEPNTSYMFEVTHADADGVQGPNPVVVPYTTQNKGVKGNEITITSVTDTTIGVAATYTGDTDNDSAAVLETRRTSAYTRFIEDSFVDYPQGTFLQNTESTRGGAWYKHPTMTPTVNAYLQNQYMYSDAELASEKLLYYHDVLASTDFYVVEATFRADSVQGDTGVVWRLHPTAETYYGFGLNVAANQWEHFKMLNGVRTVVGTEPFSGNLDQVHFLEVRTAGTMSATFLNGTPATFDMNADLPETFRVGYYAQGIVNGDHTNQLGLSSFHALYHDSSSNPWVSHGAMTANRTTKTFTDTATGLLSDTHYEVRVTFTDADGVQAQQLAKTVMTTGSAIALSSMGATTTATSSIIDVFYNNDSNNNSTLSVRYKAITDQLWTTVAFGKVKADRTTKKFSTILTGLRPSQTYEVRVDVFDPDGVLTDTPTFLVGLFTTTGLTIENKTANLHYLWKVYDPKGVYLGTLPDAPDPEFSIYENGGVTDLSFQLSREMSESNASKIIAFQNIIDIWALDPSSDGMGPNLIADPDCDPLVGAWVVSGDTFGQNSEYIIDGGPDGSSSIRLTATDTQYETSSNPIEVKGGIPLVITCKARAMGAKLRMYARAYDINDVALDSSSEIAETLGTDWQTLKVEYIPPDNTSYIRVLIRNVGRGMMWADKFSVLAKEMLIYRGRIESFTPKIDETGATVEIDVLGLASLLSDDYIEFLQFVEIQPQNDVEAGRINHGAKDPADMMKMIIDEARRVNPLFSLYYTTESIRYTGNLMQYTLRDQQIRAAMDKVRSLCPAGWHYYIEPDGLVVLRGAEHAPTHTLRIGREILRFEVEKSIRNLKNYIRVKGRQDEDMSEADGFGSINYITFDQASIDKYGKRTLFIRDAQIVDPDSAKIVGDGRLDENNREEQSATCYVPDEKTYLIADGILTGYNTQSFRAGDNVLIIDPVAGPRNTYWDQFEWDNDSWDISGVFTPLEEAVPIKTIRVRGDHVELELSQRPPSSVGDFSKFYRWMANKDMED